mmetsp:Transcript_16769/g.23896  ORF Transcript_16769/g.23896 Transcript_16769/m.23896 type:complete len:150 (+) Transcript_16769:462-911(+)
MEDVKKELAEKIAAVACLEETVSSQNKLIDATHIDSLKKTDEISRLTNEIQDCNSRIMADDTSLQEKLATLHSQLSDTEKQRDTLSKSLLDLEATNNAIVAHTQEIEKELANNRSITNDTKEEDLNKQKSLLEAAHNDILKKKTTRYQK